MLSFVNGLEEEQMAGEILKKRREELGQDLKEIAHILKINSNYLKAIEDEAFEKLPVEVYAKGYIREYARFLNIDPEIIIRAYIQKTSPPVIEKPLPAVDVIKKKKIRIKYFSIAIVLLAIGVIYILSSSAPEKPEMLPPEKITPKAQPVQPVQKKEGKPEMAAKKEKTEQAVKKHVLEILALDTTWLFVNIDNTDSKEMMLKEGESVKLSAEQGFSLKIGNAGGIKLIFDGKDIGMPGEKGQVINLNLPREEGTTPHP